MLQALIHLPQQCLLLLVRGYRLLLKPWLGNACRFEPTCSQYALDALQRHGAAGGCVADHGTAAALPPLVPRGLRPRACAIPEPGHCSAGLFTRLLHRPTDDVS